MPSKKVLWGVFRCLSTFLEGIWSPREYLNLLGALTVYLVFFGCTVSWELRNYQSLCNRLHVIATRLEERSVDLDVLPPLEAEKCLKTVTWSHDIQKLLLFQAVSAVSRQMDICRDAKRCGSWVQLTDNGLPLRSHQNMGIHVPMFH